MTQPGDSGILGAAVGKSSTRRATDRLLNNEGSSTSVPVARLVGGDAPLDTSFLRSLFLSGKIFGIVPIDLLENRKWSMSALRVYIALASFQGRNGFCYPSLQKIAERAHVARSGVQKAIGRLEEAREITVVRNGRRGNKYEVHRITTIVGVIVPSQSGIDNTTYGDVNTTLGVVPKRTVVKDQEKTIKKKRVSVSDNGRFKESDFIEFWAAYPKGDKKKDSLKKYKTVVNSGIKPETIMAGVERYKLEIKRGKTDRQYVAAAVVWLNGARWEDEAQEAAPQYSGTQEEMRERYKETF